MIDDIKKRTKIFVCTTRDTQVSQPLFDDDSMYVVHDATDDPLNMYFNESTMIQWMGQHIDEIDADWIGTAHYRRKLDVSQAEDFDINTMYVSACKLRYPSLGTYFIFHNVDDYTMLLSQPQLTIDDKIVLVEQMASKHFFQKNMFLMHKSWFKRYYDFMSRVHEALEALKLKLDLDSRDVYQRRALGFLSEQCTSAWLLRQYSTGAFRFISLPIVADNESKSPFQRSHNEDSSSSNTEERAEH